MKFKTEEENMLHHHLNSDQGILEIRPEGPLKAADFVDLAGEVDQYIEKKGNLRGLMICAESFPGWDDFVALLSHLKFVCDHRQKITKVAAVTDSKFLSALPHVASHFVKATVRHFEFCDKEAALAWLNEKEECSH